MNDDLNNSIVDVENEWDPLEEIIVGVAQGAQTPVVDKGLMVIQSDIEQIVSGPYSDRIIKETECCRARLNR